MFSQLLRLSAHSVIYGTGVLITQLVGFFLIPVYTRYLTTADYGILELLQMTMLILSTVFTMGLGSALFRSYYLHDDPHSRSIVVSSAFFFLSASSAVLSLLLILLAGDLSDLLFGSPEYALHLRLTFATAFCDATVILGLSVYRAREQPFNYISITVLRILITLGLNLLFVILLNRGMLGILEANLIAAALAYLTVLLAVIRRSALVFSLSELRTMLAFGLPMVPAALGAWILTGADRYFLQFLSTPEQLGLYSLAYKFGLAVNVLLIAPFLIAWAPFMFSVAKQRDAKQIYSRVFTYFLFATMFVALAISVLSREVLGVIAAPEFRGAYEVVPLIALSYVFYGCYSILAVGLGLHAKTAYAAITVAAAATLNLGLNYLLIPSYGMNGAAIATLVAYSVMPLGSYLASRRYYPIEYEWARVLKVCFAAALVFFGSILVAQSYAVVHSYVLVAIFKLLTLATYPILLHFLRFYRPEEIVKARDLVSQAPTYVRLRLARKSKSSAHRSQ